MIPSSYAGVLLTLQKVETLQSSLDNVATLEESLVSVQFRRYGFDTCPLNNFQGITPLSPTASGSQKFDIVMKTISSLRRTRGGTLFSAFFFKTFNAPLRSGQKQLLPCANGSVLLGQQRTLCTHRPRLETILNWQGPSQK